MSSHQTGGVTDKLGKIAMRTIAGTIVLMSAVVLIAKGVDGFPFGAYGLAVAGLLAIVAFAVGQVE